MEISPLAGKPASRDLLVDIPKLVTAYYTGKPDVAEDSQRVSFGTSGHRGSSFNNSFNENHILAITQAICIYRKEQKTDGPLFLGFDTHALSAPAFATAMEVLAANQVEVMIARDDEYTPTPAVSYAILKYNNGRNTGLADGIVITPSHNPPDNGGFKYNPPHGGPAGNDVTGCIERSANELLKHALRAVKRIDFAKALTASTTHRYDYLNTYVNDLGSVVDLVSIRRAGLKIGVDPLGGAGIHYWEPIADKYKIDLAVVNTVVDPTFGFMTVDWDGQIRMDPSSPYAMQRLIAMKAKFDISFACDTDHDRHGIVSKMAGLLNPNHYLSVAIDYLLQHRPQWLGAAAVGKTVVTTALIDRIASKHNRKLFDVPVGFKWFADGLLSGALCFGGEESAGASFSRSNGTVWTTDKDGLVPALLSAEILAKTGNDPAQRYKELAKDLGEPAYSRIEVKATQEQQEQLKKLSADQVHNKELAGEKITHILTHAPGNDALLGGIKLVTENTWCAIRPSGTEAIYKIYAESFLGDEQVKKATDAARKIVETVLKK